MYYVYIYIHRSWDCPWIWVISYDYYTLMISETHPREWLNPKNKEYPMIRTLNVQCVCCFITCNPMIHLKTSSKPLEKGKENITFDHLFMTFPCFFLCFPMVFCHEISAPWPRPSPGSPVGKKTAPGSAGSAGRSTPPRCRGYLPEKFTIVIYNQIKIIINHR